MISKTTSFTLLFFYTLCSFSQDALPTFSEQKLVLNGEWKVVMYDFVDPADLTTKDNSIPLNVPSTWNELIWDKQKVGSFGFATYFKQFIYTGDLQNTQLSIEVPEISLAYKLFANEDLIAQVGTPGETAQESKPRVAYQVADLEVQQGDTITLAFHISNFRNKSGGMWYAPTIDYKSKSDRRIAINRALKLIVLGFIIIAGVFHLSIFITKPSERFAIYFFFVCVSISMLLLTRGDMPLMDLFPDTNWTTLKKTLYLAIVLIAPANALFLGEMYKSFYHKRLIKLIAYVSLGLSVFIVLAPVRISYSAIPYLHVYNIVIGVYLLSSLIRAALARKFGAKYLLIGYVAGFLAILHDMLSSNYVIEGYAFDMTHLGVALYMLQLMFLITSRYLFTLKGNEDLSNHLKKVNEELEIMVDRRTKALSDKTKIIEKQNAELKKAMQEKDHLMAVVAHDLKAPLSSILGISEMMGTNLEGQSAQFNEMIQKVTNDGRAMIESLTELKVYEEDGFEVQRSIFNLVDFFERKRITFEASANKKGISFNSVLDSQTKMISTDESILGRIIDNLLSNALKFTPKGGNVDFMISRQQDTLRVIINDNGPGFSEKDKAKVFQKFTRLSARPTAGESSAGLGLSIVKTLVELLGGSVELKSEKGSGAKFTVSIPI